MVDAPPVQKVRLHGREADLAAIRRLCASAVAGHGGALVLTAGPGEGRTSLLNAAAATTGAASKPPTIATAGKPSATSPESNRATSASAGSATTGAAAASWMVLSAAGHGDEQLFAYAGLQRLLEPVGDRIAELGAAQRARVTDALGGGSGDPAAVGPAVLELLRAQARRQPVLCLLDDAHLLDGPTRQVLLFVARRVAVDRIALLFTAPTIAALPGGLPVRRLAPLDEAAARELLAEQAPDLAADVAAALMELAAGNPAALAELAAGLTPAQRRGYAPAPVTLPADGALRRRYRAELAALPADTRSLLLLAAAEPVAPTAALLAAGGRELADLEPAELAGLVTVAGTVRFTSPLLRATAYHAEPAARRQAAHRALAHALEARGARLPALLHRAAATTGPDDRLAAELAEAARLGDAADAATAQRYAAELRTSPAEAAAALLDAARSAWLAGRPQDAGALIRRIERAPADPAARLCARRLAAEVRLRDDGSAAADTLLDVAGQLAASDPAAALEALALAGESAFLAEQHGRYADLARRLTIGAESAEPPLELTRRHVAGLAHLAAGRDSAGFANLQRSVQLADRITEPAPLIRAATAALIIGDGHRAYALGGRAAALARGAGATTLVPQALELAAMGALAAGDYPAATGAALDGAALAQASSQPALADAHRALLAVLAALVGDHDTALCRIRAVSGAREQSRALCDWAFGLLDLVDGRYAAAAARLAGLVAAPQGHGSALLRVAVVPHLVEAAAQAGASPALDAVVTAFDTWTSRTGRPGWLALRDRCRGLRAGDPAAAEEHFRAALQWTGDAGFPRAHTELLYGRLLRRGRRPAEARTHLRRATETFRLLDAGPWAVQSARELRAAGERGPEELVAISGAGLTAQQERIAALVAEGATNREVAQELQLSPRTVDHHLRNVFARLGVRSRTEMARLLHR